jgi:hypothetical protein
VQDKALAIVGQGKPVESLVVNELDLLLAWHQTPKTTGARKADKLEQWKAILADGRPPPLFAPWTDDDEERLRTLCSDEIDIGDTQYGRESALKERELEAAVYTMSPEKRDELRRTLEELEVAEPTSADASGAVQVAVSMDDETGAV